MQNIPTRFVTALHKLASYGKPDYSTDNQEKALQNVDSNRKDSKKQLEGLFSHTKSVEKHQTKTMDKALPGGKEKETGNPLLKVAFTNAFRDMRLIKSAGELGVMYLSFRDELDKIGLSK